MRLIGNLPSAAQAQLFRDYLYARGIGNELEQDADASWMVWVLAEEQLETARELLDRFRRDPAAPEFARQAAGAAQLRVDEAEDHEAFQKRFFTGRQIFAGTRTFGAGVLSYALIGGCIVVAFFSNFGRDTNWLRFLFISYPGIGVIGFLPEIRAGEVWRLFTPMLIHFSVAHLLFNMLWLFELGSMIEGRQGRIRFALLTLLLSAGSNLAQYVVAGPGFGGMSGVVYGLFGYIWLRGKLDPASGLFIDRQTVVLMLVWFLACFTGWVGPIANAAHGAGLGLGAASGCLAGLLARRHRR
jgi:GlpG protein